MKELSIEEKAKAYDEAIERANELNYVSDKDSLQRKTVEHIFPELAESEDEKIRRLIKNVILKSVPYPQNVLDGGESITAEDAIAWLEKQGEQKPADNVKPKFKVGDIIRHKKYRFTCKIIAVDTEYRVSECPGTHLPFEAQDAYELVEQKPDWSEKDRKHLNDVIRLIQANFGDNGGCDDYYEKLIDWLKSLKNRIQPQPKQEYADDLRKAMEL